MTGPADSDPDDVSNSAQRAATTGPAPNPYALPLSVSELRELEQGLGSFGLHRVLGLFCAVASVPRKVPDRIWLEELLEDASFSDEASFRSLAERLIPLAEHVSERLGEGEMEPLVPEAADVESCAAWAKGYASILRHIDPSGLANEVIEAAFAIQALAGEPATLELVDSLRGERSRAEFLAEQRERLADDAGFLYESWADEPKLPLVGTIRRSEPKVGRNDPCPCGSGKKYKKCCAP